MNAVDILKYGHQTALQTLDGLPYSGWDTGGVCGVWSVKNIIAHLASYEHLLVEVLSTFLEGGPTPYMVKIGEHGLAHFNDSEVALRQNKSPDDTLTEYNTTQAKTMGLAAGVAPETWRQIGTLPWYGPEYSLDDYIVYTYYGHKREHCAQIALFRDRLSR